MCLLIIALSIWSFDKRTGGISCFVSHKLWLPLPDCCMLHNYIQNISDIREGDGEEVRKDWNVWEKKKQKMNSARQNWIQQKRIGCNGIKYEIWIDPWWYSHSICLSVGLHWYSGESAPSSSTYQKAMLWSINMPWESKLFSLIALVICPETV